MDADLKAALGTSLQDLSKASSQGAKLVVMADGALAKMNSVSDGELMEMNLGKLRLVAEEAEEVPRVIVIT